MQGLIVFSGRDDVKDQFTTVTDGGNITITGYTGKATVVSIPEKINGLPVTANVIPTGNLIAQTTSVTGKQSFFRLAQTGLADYDSVTNNANQGGGNPPGGPVLTSVTPNTGVRGTIVVLTMVLGGMAPPANVSPTSATVGSIVGSNLSRNGTSVTSSFVIPANATPGAVTVSVVFPGPPGMGNVTFAIANGFTIR